MSEIKVTSENKSTQSNKLVSYTLLRGTSFNFIVICSEVTTWPRLKSVTLIMTGNVASGVLSFPTMANTSNFIRFSDNYNTILYQEIDNRF